MPSNRARRTSSRLHAAIPPATWSRALPGSNTAKVAAVTPGDTAPIGALRDQK